MSSDSKESEINQELQSARERIAELERELEACRAESRLEIERLELLFQRAPLGYQSLDEQGNFLEVNRTWLDLLGYERDEVIGRNYTDFLTPECVERFRENFPRFLNEGEIHGAEMELLKKDGTTILVSFEGRIGRDEDGAFKQTHCLFHDIGEQRRAEHALKQSEERFRRLSDVLPQLVSYTDKDLVYRFVNKSYERFFGVSSDELVGRTVPEVIGPRAFEAAKGYVRRALAGEVVDYQARLEYPGERTRFMEASLIPDVASTGEVRGYYAVLHDVSHLKETEEELKESEAKFRGMFENVRDAVFLHEVLEDGSPGPFLDFNQAAMDRLGYSREELMRLDPTTLDDPVVIREVVPRVMVELQDKGHALFESVQLAKDGRRIPVENHTRLVEAGDRRMLVTVCRDISERKRVEEALRESEAKFRAFFENAGEGIIISDIESNVLQANPMAVHLLGYESEQGLIGLNARELIHPEDLEATPLATTRQEAASGGIVRAERRYKKADGSYIPVDVTIKFIPHTGLHHVMFQDITERKRAQEELERSKATLLTILESMPAHIYVADLVDHRVLFMNEAMRRDFGGDYQGSLCWEVFRGLKGPCELCKNDELLDEAGKPAGPITWEDVNPLTGRCYLNTDQAVFWVDGRVVRLQIALDITERKKAEEQLRLTQFSVDKAAHSIFWITPEGRFVYVNDAACDNLGYTCDELTGMAVWDVDPDHSGEIRPERWKRYKEQGATTFETRHRTKTGEVFPVQVTSFHLEYEGREYEFSYAQDITERKRAETELLALSEELEAYRRLMQDMSENMIDMLWAKDLDGRYIFANKAIREQLLCSDEAEVIGNTDVFFAERQRGLGHEHTFGELCADSDRIVVESGQPGRFIEDGLVQGEYLCLDVRKSPLYDRDGVMIGTVGTGNDITQQKRAEDALKESEQRFKNLLEDVDMVAVQGYDEDRRVIYWNTASERLYGFSKQEASGRRIEDLIIPEFMREEVIRAIEAWMNHGVQVPAGELELVHKDGSLVSVYSSHVMQENVAGGKEMYCIDVDLAEIKKAHAQLLQAKEMAEAANQDKTLILQSISDMVAFYETPELLIKWTNQASAESVGATVNGLTGKHCYDQWGEGGKPCEDCPVLEVFRTGKAKEHERESPDGRVWHLRAYPAFDDSGAIRGVVEVGRDFTEQKRARQERERAQERLRRSEELLRITQSVSRVGGWFRDLESGEAYWTEEHYRILGYEPGEARPSLELFMQHVHPDDRERVERARAAALAGDGEYSVEYRLERKDGEIRHMRSTGRIFGWNHDAPLYMFGSIQDISEQKNVEEALRRSLAEKEAMLLEIHHRVKNNLQIILGLLDLSWSRAESEEGEEIIREVHGKINSMALIHTELYREQSLESIDIAGFASKLLVHLQRLYESPGVRVEVLGDKVRLSLEKAIPLGLVLNELFTNALKYAFPEREGLLACEIRRRDGRVEVKVADDGVGLPQGFDPQTTNTLGFKLVRNLVQLQLGGEMKIDGKAGAAVSISFRIDHGENP